MKIANMEPVKVDFHLNVISRLYDKVSVLGVEDVVIVDNGIGCEVGIRSDLIGNAVGLLGGDESEVNSELNRLYIEAAEEAERDVEERTKVVLDISNGIQAIVWRGRDGWMYCTAGSTCDGLAFESEDFGPFASRADAYSSIWHALQEEENE